MEKETPKTIEEKYDDKMKKILDESSDNKVNSKDEKGKTKKLKTKKEKSKKVNSKKSLKDKFKEISDINTDEAIEISFKMDSKTRKKLTTIVLLIFLIIGSFFIKYSVGDISSGNNESKEELNSILHFEDILKYPDFDDIINNKSMFKDRLIYSEAIVKNQERESENCLKLEVSLSSTEEKTAYLYYIVESKDLVLKNEKITFIGRIESINSNKKYIEIDAIRIDTGNGLFSETDMQKIASIYSQKDDVVLENTTRTIKTEKYGSGYRNYCFDIVKESTSNFPNEFRIIDSNLQSDIIDSTSVQGEVYSRIDVNESLDMFIKMKKDFKAGTFTLEFYDLDYNKIFEKSWKNIHTSDKFAYDYVSNDGLFYINIENIIYIFNEKTGEEVKIDVSGRGYIDVDYKGNVYYISLDDDGYVACYTKTGEAVWKESLISITKLNDYEVKSVNDIVVVDNAKVIVSFDVSKVLEDRKESATREFAMFKAKFGTRITDTLD